jgi:hypothetical protein
MIKTGRSIVPIVIILVIFLISMPVSADGSASFGLSASASTVRQGDTVTISGNISASAVVGTFDLDVRYDPKQLQYVKAEILSPVQSGEIDFSAGSGSIQVLYLDNDGGASGVKTGSLFRLTFKVIAGQPGDSIGLSYNIRTAGDANASGMSTSGTGTALKVAAPLSTNNNLASLSINPGGLTPGFSKNTTQYTAAVPFEINRLKISAEAEDSKAKVSINNPEIPAGGSAVISVTVTAESGAQKTYKIKASRGQDPNYEPSGNNNLDSLAVEGFLLSPGFSSASAEYVVYLPYEVDSLKIQAAAADSKAAVTSISGQNSLLPGTANLIEVTVTAENGSTKVYTIAALRAKEFSGLADLVNGEIPEPTPVPSVSETVPTTTVMETSAPESDVSQTTEGTGQSYDGSAVSTAAIILISVLSALVLTAAGFLIWIFAVKRIRL